MNEKKTGYQKYLKTHPDASLEDFLRRRNNLLKQTVGTVPVVMCGGVSTVDLSPDEKWELFGNFQKNDFD